VTLASRVGRWIRGGLAENLTLKLFCLLVSLLFYGHLHGAQNAQRSFSISVVTLLPVDDERVLMVDPPSAVRVTLTGSRPILDDLKSDELGSIQLDLRQARGTYAPLDISRLKVPAGLAVEVDPPGILLAWDAVVSRPIPVQIPLAGQPARGFAVQGPPVAEPAVVSARGPQTLVEMLQLARTEPFDVEGLTAEGTLKRKLPLEMPPPRVVFAERSVLAAVTVGRARTERVFQKLVVQVVGVIRSTVAPGEVDVRVAGPPELVEDLRPEQVVPIADVHSLAGDARTGSMPVPVSVALDGCSAQVVPPTVVVRW
jgi:hypothetical protein